MKNFNFGKLILKATVVVGLIGATMLSISSCGTQEYPYKETIHLKDLTYAGSAWVWSDEKQTLRSPYSGEVLRVYQSYISEERVVIFADDGYKYVFILDGGDVVEVETWKPGNDWLIDDELINID